MYGNQYNIQRFLEMADTYFRLTGKTASTMSGVDMEEFYSCISQCSAPEELHKFIKSNVKQDESGTRENVRSGGWGMLPPAQRIL